MLERIKRPLSLLSAIIMATTLLGFLPANTFSENRLGIIASAEENYNNGFLEDGSYQSAEKINSDNYSDYGFTADNWKTFKDYYAISNAGQLYWFATKSVDDPDIRSSNVVLTDDIVVNKNVLKSDGSLADNASTFRKWIPIAGSEYYGGTFNGQGHTISGLYFDDGSVDCVGLFARTNSYAKIYNVGIIDTYFNGSHTVGSITGYFHESTFENCYSRSTLLSSGGSSEKECRVGGLVGRSYTGTIKNCYFVGKVGTTSSYTSVFVVRCRGLA